MPSKIKELTQGMAMIVTDLHGDWNAYQSYRNCFLELYKHKKVDYFILCGDYVHNDNTELDSSLEILQDLQDLQMKYGNEVIIPLCGNHEFPHIYNIPLMRGSQDCTSFLEKKILQLENKKLDATITFLKSSPFYIRTLAGVMIAHAGAHKVPAQKKNVSILTNWDHDAFILEIEKYMNKAGRENLKQDYQSTLMVDYDYLAELFFGAKGPNDRNYYHLLRSYIFHQNPKFSLLWHTLFTKNEQEFGEQEYCNIILPMFLETWSQNAPAKQSWLVSGHIATENGYKVVGEQQLRIASFSHATPPNSGKYLLLDCKNKQMSMKSLLAGLQSLPHFI